MLFTLDITSSMWPEGPLHEPALRDGIHALTDRWGDIAFTILRTVGVPPGGPDRSRCAVAFWPWSDEASETAWQFMWSRCLTFNQSAYVDYDQVPLGPYTTLIPPTDRETAAALRPDATPVVALFADDPHPDGVFLRLDEARRGLKAWTFAHTQPARVFTYIPRVEGSTCTVASAAMLHNFYAPYDPTWIDWCSAWTLDPILDSLSDVLTLWPTTTLPEPARADTLELTFVTHDDRLPGVHVTDLEADATLAAEACDLHCVPFHLEADGITVTFSARHAGTAHTLEATWDPLRE